MSDPEQVWVEVEGFPEYETNGRGVVRSKKRKYILKPQTEESFDRRKSFNFYSMRRNKYFHRVPISKILEQSKTELVEGRLKV